MTLASDLKESEADARLILQSRAGNEAIVLLSAETDYYQEFEDVRRIEKYVKQRNISQLPESIRKIIQAKQAEAKERERSATHLLKEAIVKGAFYIAGERVQIRRSSVKETLDEAMNRLVEDVYSKLSYVDSFTASDAEIQKILSGSAVQETMSGIDRPNARALEEMRQYLEVRSRQHMTVTMSEMQKRYQAAPYGWREIDIAALVATLVRAQKVQLMYGGTALLPSDRKTVDCLRKRTETEKTLVQQKISAPDILIKRARKLAEELFGSMDMRTDEESLCGQLETLLTNEKQKNEGILALYTDAVAYPGRSVVESGKTALDGVLLRRGDNVAFLEAFTKAEDDLLDWLEDVQKVEFFFKHQKKIFDDAWKMCENVQKEKNYFMDEAQAMTAVETMREILRAPKPYQRIMELPTLAQQVSEAYDRINEARRGYIQEAVVQARGDIHTLAGDDPELRREIRKVDDELERRREEALHASSPTLVDASVMQIRTYARSVCHRLENIIANKNNAYAPKDDITELHRYDLLPQKRLSSEAEINAYVEALREKLRSALKDHDAIQII